MGPADNAACPTGVVYHGGGYQLLTPQPHLYGRLQPAGHELSACPARLQYLNTSDKAAAQLLMTLRSMLTPSCGCVLLPLLVPAEPGLCQGLLHPAPCGGQGGRTRGWPARFSSAAAS